MHIYLMPLLSDLISHYHKNNVQSLLYNFTSLWLCWWCITAFCECWWTGVLLEIVLLPAWLRSDCTSAKLSFWASWGGVGTAQGLGGTLWGWLWCCIGGGCNANSCCCCIVVQTGDGGGALSDMDFTWAIEEAIWLSLFSCCWNKMKWF